MATQLETRVQANLEFALRIIEQTPGRYDPARLLSAATLALDPARFSEACSKYETTIWRCRCPDYTYRGTVCKHMLARMLEGCIFA